MDELGFNKLFAGVLLAGLLLMAGVKFADILVPHTELAQNAYVIEVPETTDVAGAAPVETGPEPILALLAEADPVAGEKLAKKYSAALTGFGGVWDYQSLNGFLAKPKAYISGTKMNFAGLKKPKDRANMIAYLRQQADAAAALPTAEEIAAESAS